MTPEAKDRFLSQLDKLCKAHNVRLLATSATAPGSATLAVYEGNRYNTEVAEWPYTRPVAKLITVGYEPDGPMHD